VDTNVNAWLQRFAALDAQEEEGIDQGARYRALMREQKHDPVQAHEPAQPHEPVVPAEASAAAQARERKLRQPVG